jgi:SAM-dependent methyltransferase
MADDGLRKRLFAQLLVWGGRRHEQLLAERKRALLGGLRGDVLEVGPGTGVNLAYLDPSVHWIAVEPNRFLRERAQAEAARLGVRADVLAGTAERLPLPAASVDAVISTLVLCSVADQSATLREIRRVLRRGGCFVFVEHVGAREGTGLRRAQRLVKPVWRAVLDGCEPDRDTAAAIERAGFVGLTLERFETGVWLAGPHIAGSAVAPG